MGYYSVVEGVVRLSPVLTREQATELVKKIMAERGEHGVGDWTLTVGLDGLMCAWEDEFKASYAKEGLEKILAEMLPEGVTATGRIEVRGETNEDIEAWVVKEGKMTVLEARVVLDVEAFAEEVLRQAEATLEDTFDADIAQAIKESVVKVFSEFGDEDLEDDERLCLEDWPGDDEEEDRDDEDEDDTWDDDVDGEDE